jgi:hypothetical protein
VSEILIFRLVPGADPTFSTDPVETKRIALKIPFI